MFRKKFEVESEREAIIRRGWEAMDKIRQQAVENGTSEMTLDEINEVIREYREERRQKNNNNNQ